ncbi:Salicylate 1-monooxygenase [Rhizobium sp. CF080]|uniref:FAD-dependent monooxygenase n=1 Tax=Rhizobium sp. (strain CF080) TaxID=1144310 RepID=UPI0002715FB6|nr:FAD-dependent monooxygenase [Rhizobium sp. CF080]EUB98978.1 Salicylate 1-monooxygenase [Rhizobium sp. CF080]
MKISIVGGGIGGLTAALSLLRQGFDVDVYEQAVELKEVGAGVQVSANGTRILFSLGLEEDIMSVASQAQGKEIRLWNTGQTWKLFDLGPLSIERYGFPYITIHRNDLHQTLAAGVRRIKPDAIKLSKKCVGITQDDKGATITFADGTSATSDIVVGADGVHSKIRETLFGRDDPKFTGIVAWRGVIPVERLPEHMLRPVGTNWIGPGGHVIQYLLRGGKLMNYVSVVERSNWQVESWSVAGTTEECLADYQGWHEDIHTLIKAIDVPYKWALMLRPPMDDWTRGRVTLLGDACHPTLPFLAQGAVMAIEDGFVLARALAENNGKYEAAFAGYEAARVERTGKIVRGAEGNLSRFHNAALKDPKLAEDYVNAEWQEDKVKQRYEWLFTYDATSVPVVAGSKSPEAVA